MSRCILTTKNFVYTITSIVKAFVLLIILSLIENRPIKSSTGGTWPPMAHMWSRAGSLTAGTHGG